MDVRESLKALPGVRVVVEDFGSAAENAGFDKRAFQTDVELRLRMAGVRVLETKGNPLLYLNVNVLHRKAGEMGAFHITLELIQRAIIRSQLRSGGEGLSEDALANSTMGATTWTTGLTGFGAVADVRDATKNLVDEFANDWLAVNPPNGTA